MNVGIDESILCRQEVSEAPLPDRCKLISPDRLKGLFATGISEENSAKCAFRRCSEDQCVESGDPEAVKILIFHDQLITEERRKNSIENENSCLKNETEQAVRDCNEFLKSSWPLSNATRRAEARKRRDLLLAKLNTATFEKCKKESVFKGDLQRRWRPQAKTLKLNQLRCLHGTNSEAMDRLNVEVTEGKRTKIVHVTPKRYESETLKEGRRVVHFAPQDADANPTEKCEKGLIDSVYRETAD